MAKDSFVIFPNIGLTRRRGKTILLKLCEFVFLFFGLDDI